ncbi:MAG: hypothetical protein WC609_01225 [Candidatus Paceibacterota bacterium]|jgi:hypothetical protein
MRQATLQLKSRIKNVNITNSNFEAPRVILNTMLATLAGLAFLYVLILGNMVFDIVERKALEKEMLTLTSEVGGLELAYLNVSNSVDMDLSASMGFREAKATFATRKALGQIKTTNNEI